jgi:hypothetical protein
VAQALLLLPNGQKVLRLGKTSRVTVGDATKIIAHSHPSGFLMLSDEAGQDLAQLAKRNMTETYLIGPDGSLVRWTSNSGKWLNDVDDVIGQIIVDMRRRANYE